MDNRTIAQTPMALAHSLQEKNAILYRVMAYRRAAQTIMGLDQPVEELVSTSGRNALKELPGIGARLSAKIEVLARGGDIANLKEESQLTPV